MYHGVSGFFSWFLPRLKSWFLRRRWGEPLVYAFIFLTGSVFFLFQLWTWVIPQLTQYQEFVPVEAAVLETRIVEKQGDHQQVFRPEVHIEYRVKDVSYRLWTFDYRTLQPKEGFGPDRTKSERLLLPFHVGQKIPCWYWGEHPEKAIVVWDVSVWGWFFLVLSFSLALLGMIGLMQSFRQHQIFSLERKASSLSSFLPFPSLTDSVRRSVWPTVPDIRIVNESPGTHLTFRLPIGNSPLFPLVGLTLFGLAWNAVAWGVMLHSFLNPAENWQDQIFATGFRMLFWGMGILLLLWITHQIFLAFSLGPTILEISDHPVYPGRRYRILLHQTGVLRFHSLTVEIACEEVARFHQGTDTITNRKTVFEQVLFQRTDFETTYDIPLEQEFLLELPIGVMHSFRQDNNEVLWNIVVAAQIAGWPDIRRECPIVVHPVVLSDTVHEGRGL